MPPSAASQIRDLRVDARRFEALFAELSAIGATGDGGVDRPAFSRAHTLARRWFVDRARSLGLATAVDGAANHSARLGCGRKRARTLLVGSHLDSVPRGGRFDGALGVAAGLEALASVKESGIQLAWDLEVADFTDEEGRFVGMMGSRAMAGRLSSEDLDRACANGEEFERRLAERGMTRAGILDAARRPETLAGYLELHIEQGRRLCQQGVDIGVVTAVVGLCTVEVHFIGLAPGTDATFMYSGTYANQQALYMALHRKAESVGFDFAEKGLVGFPAPHKLSDEGRG